MTDRPTILLPRQVLEGDSIQEGVPTLLSGAHVLLLGYHVLPEQTATEQAREQFGERATKRLEEFEAMLADAGATVETRLVFTHEAQQTINRVLVEEECLAVLIPKATPPVEDVLVAVRGRVGQERLVRLLGALFADAEASLTLFHVTDAAELDADVEAMLSDLETALLDAGIAADRLETRSEPGGKPLDRIAEAATGADVVVMGETDPSVATFVFGLPEEQLAQQFLGPVLVVQRPPGAETADEPE
jgi:nucleotide-binding universal stress UspA family protein